MEQWQILTSTVINEPWGSVKGRRVPGLLSNSLLSKISFLCEINFNIHNIHRNAIITFTFTAERNVEVGTVDTT
jgi:hypothetical protein